MTEPTREPSPGPPRWFLAAASGLQFLFIGLMFLFVASVLGVGLLVLYEINRCVVEGTRVETLSGPRPVEELRVGDLVQTRGPHGIEPGTIVAISRSRALSHLELGFAGGRRLRLTGNHPVADASGWTRARDLTPATSLQLRHGREPLRSVERVYGPVTVFDLTVAPNPNFFAEGVLVHNKSIPAHESGMIGDARSVISAQAAYQSANFGYYDGRLECLNRPSLCISGYGATAPTFLDPVIAGLHPNRGYERAFYPGPAVEGTHPYRSPTSVERWAYVGVPLESDSPARYGVCADSRSVVCITLDGTPPQVEDAQCVVTGEDIPTPPWYSWFTPPPGPSPCYYP